MDHIDPPHLQIIGYQRAMAAPPENFGAHDRRTLPIDGVEEAGDASLELLGLHVIGIASKGAAAPGSVGGSGIGTAAAAELGEMKVFDARPGKRLRQQLRIEMRIGAGAGELPHIGEKFYLMPLQHRDELLDRMCRVSYRPDRHRFILDFRYRIFYNGLQQTCDPRQRLPVARCARINI
jgi:hypothetical protein